jgi:hypothetical protein
MEEYPGLRNGLGINKIEIENVWYKSNKLCIKVIIIND